MPLAESLESVDARKGRGWCGRPHWFKIVLGSVLACVVLGIMFFPRPPATEAQLTYVEGPVTAVKQIGTGLSATFRVEVAGQRSPFAVYRAPALGVSLPEAIRPGTVVRIGHAGDWEGTRNDWLTAYAIEADGRPVYTLADYRRHRQRGDRGVAGMLGLSAVVGVYGLWRWVKRRASLWVSHGPVA